MDDGDQYEEVLVEDYVDDVDISKDPHTNQSNWNSTDQSSVDNSPNSTYQQSAEPINTFFSLPDFEYSKATTLLKASLR